ncbi:pectate lyase [Hymenobacter sp. BT175]|uniref:pectate lyase family protein n=1 Tax=Hymenobacter translucens TaxID=2886507 RepID=UPI001D0E8DAE|nr:pectate lyase [Hymenobacter translucens]MCC2547364.1 pectate lyase [Hymenobacter translucens]
MPTLLFQPAVQLSASRLRAGLLGFTLALGLPAAAQQQAFPGAEGAGRFTSGGRGTVQQPTTVFEVTHLSDDGKPGSLRYALSEPAAARTVVFRVSGTIHLSSALSIAAPNTTIAGQTAPGDGICLADYPVSVKASNVIVRFVRFRMGDKNQNQGFVHGAGGDDAFGGGFKQKHIIVDHCSMSWSTDEAFSLYEADSTTLQWNLISEPLNYSYHFESGDKDFEHHGYGGIMGGLRTSIHHNLFAHCNSRTPRFNGSRHGAGPGHENVDFRNNVIYNWGENNVYGGEGGNYNVVNNYYKAGPSTRPSVQDRVLNPYKQDAAGKLQLPFGKFYVMGNYVEGSPAVTADNWRGVQMNGGSSADKAQSRVEKPFELGLVATQKAREAYEAVLAGAGATRPRRDTLDERIVRNVRTRTGRLIDVPGGYPHGTPYTVSQQAWPVLQTGPVPADTDHDGMPDLWEKSRQLNPQDPTDRSRPGTGGYTMLELYLNSLVSVNGLTPAQPVEKPARQPAAPVKSKTKIKVKAAKSQPAQM